MSNGWKEVIEEGQVFWVHEEYGNVLKAGDGVFISLLPKVIRLGPFETLEQAQQALTSNKQSLESWLDQYNDSLVNLSKEVKK